MSTIKYHENDAETRNWINGNLDNIEELKSDVENEEAKEEAKQEIDTESQL